MIFCRESNENVTVALFLTQSHDFQHRNQEFKLLFQLFFFFFFGIVYKTQPFKYIVKELHIYIFQFSSDHSVLSTLNI